MIKDRHQIVCKQHHNGYQKESNADPDLEGMAVYSFFAVQIPFSVNGAGQRLQPLGQTVEQGRSHQGQVGDDAICRDAGIAGQLQQDKIEYHGSDSVGDLPHEGHNAQDACRCQLPKGGKLSYKADGIFGGEIVQQANRHTDRRRDGGGQSSTGQAHSHGEHKDIVEYDVEYTAAQCGGHGNAGCPVVAHESCEGIIEHKERRAAEDDLYIGLSQTGDGAVCPQQIQDVPGEQDACGNKGQTYENGTDNGIGEIVLCAFRSLGFQQGILCGGSDADHGSNGKDKPIYRQDQVQGSDPVCPFGGGDKKGVGQDVAGCAYHGQDIGCDIISQLFFDHTISCMEKALPLTTAEDLTS